MLSPFIQEVRIGLLWDAERVFIIPALLISIILIINLFSAGKLRLSPLIVSIILFYFYKDFIFFIHGNLKASLLINHLMGLFFIIIIDNLKFTKYHYKQYHQSLMFLGFIIAFVSLYQFFIDSNFYTGSLWLREDMVAFGNVARNQSIFSRIGLGLFIMGIVFNFYLFKNYPKFKLINLLISSLFVTPIFLSFTRGAYLFPLIGIAVFFYFRGKRYRAFRVLPFILIFLFFVSIIYSQYTNTAFIQDRMLSTSYEKRFEAFSVFFDRFATTNVIFGWGRRNIHKMSIEMTRSTGVLNGFIQVYIMSGLIGLLLFINVIIRLFNKAKGIFINSNNPVFYAILIGFVIVNLTASVDEILTLPIYYILVMMKIMQQVDEEVLLIKTNK